MAPDYVRVAVHCSRCAEATVRFWPIAARHERQKSAKNRPS